METTSLPSQSPRRKRPVAVLIAFGIAGVAAIGYLTSHTGDYNLTLALAAKAENLSYPKMVDEETRIDSVTASSDLVYHYYYSFPNMATEDVSNESFCADWEAVVLENLKKVGQSKEFGKHGVTLMFTMRDKTGAHLCTVTLPPERYYQGQ